MIRAAFAHLVRAVAGALARWARQIEGRPFTGNEFGKEFCLALGLNPSGTGDITLHVPVEGAVTATVERYVKDQDVLLKTMAHSGAQVPAAILVEVMQQIAPRCIGTTHAFGGLIGEMVRNGTRCACGALIYGANLGERITHVEAHDIFISPHDIARCIGSHMWLDGLDEEEWRIIADCFPALMREDWMRTQRPSAYRRWTSFRKERKLEGKTQNATR